MSAQALIWAANVRGLKPATKIVLIQLAERHNKDTGMCNPSIKTLADDCEMDRTTVMRHIDVLAGLGLISKTANGGEGVGRQVNEYQLHMPKVIPTDVSGVAKSQNPTGAKSQSDGGLSRNPTGAKSHSCATLTLREPLEENLSLFGSIEPQSVREAEQPKDDQFSAFWNVYPKKVKKPEAQKAWAKAIKTADPKAIIAAVEVYSTTDTVRRGFVLNPATFLTGRRFDDPDVQPEVAPDRRARFQPPSHEEVFR